MKPFPIAAKIPHELTIHGKTRVDDYYWLRHKENPEVLKYLHAQMDYLEDAMGHTESLQEWLFSEMKGRIQETDSTVPEERGGYLYYERTEAGKQYPIFCRKKASAESPEEILLDQNGLAEGKPFCSVSSAVPEPTSGGSSSAKASLAVALRPIRTRSAGPISSGRRAQCGLTLKSPSGL